MTLTEATTFVEKLLESSNVKSVYYIDDVFSENFSSSVLEYIQENHLDDIKRIPKISQEILMAKKADSLSVGIISDWALKLTREDKDYILKDCIQHNSSAENSINKIFRQNCTCCSPMQWSTTYLQEYKEKIDKGENVLLLFDYKLVGEGGRTGIDLANTIQNKDHTFCGIFSQEFEIDKEFVFRNRVEFSSLKEWAFPLSKDRLKDNSDYSSFVEGLHYVICVKDVDSLNKKAIIIIQDTTKEMVKEFERITPPDFKQLVINSSKEEGCREIDSLLRLIHIIFDKQIRKYLSSNPSVLDSFQERIEKIVDIDSTSGRDLSQIYDKNILNSYFQDEAFISYDTINMLLTPLQNGDVFEINSKYYILLCQPCNISIRKDGRRGNGYDIGFLVPLHEEKSEEDIINKQIDLIAKQGANATATARNKLLKLVSNHPFLSKIGGTIDQKKYVAALNEYKTISLSLLDYSTFSEEGRVVVNGPKSNHLHRTQKALAENHSKKFKHISDFSSFIKDFGLKKESIKQKKIELSFFDSILAKLGLLPSDKVLYQYEFPIKRYGHLQDPYSSALLTSLSHYISRSGFPNPFY